MYRPYFLTIVALLFGAGFLVTSAALAADPQGADDQSQGTSDRSPPAPESADASVGGGQPTSDKQEAVSKIYVPYKELKGVFEKEGQGVFLPYKEFQKLWRAAQGKPADVSEVPFEYLISTARFQGKVKQELATFNLELTIDILGDGWIEVPISLGEVAVSAATLTASPAAKSVPLLRVVNGQYVFVTKGKGRYVLALDFVRQLETQVGLAVLKYRIPPAAITTLELLIPEENLKVDVQPMLAATTSQVEVEAAKGTRLQAFLGSATEVSLSWKPKTEAAAELETVVICEQFQHIHVAEALISQEVSLNYTIHRGGIDSFRIRLPGQFRLTDVTGANIAKWDITSSAPAAAEAWQELEVKLFSPAKDKYTLTVKMERFLQDSDVEISLSPIVAEQALRQTGLIGITYSPRRVVFLKDTQNLARVDTGQLPEHLRQQPNVTAYRFINSDYSGKIVIGTASPRIVVDQQWMLGVDKDRLELRGRLHYNVERTGLFELNMTLPEPWVVESLGPDSLVDDYDLKGQADKRVLHILLKGEKTGEFDLILVAGSSRTQPEGSVDFTLPLADANNLQLYHGQLILLLADQLQAEVGEIQQLQTISLQQAQSWTTVAGLSPAMAFEFRAVDREKWAGTRFKISVKPVQISATVHRLVNIQPGSVEQEAIIQYRIRYAPVDTLYVKMPVALADAGVQISGPNIKEKPRIDQLPADQRDDTNEPAAGGIKWAYFKVALQSKVSDSYELKVQARRSFRAGEVGQAVTVEVEPILAAGKLSDQSGHIAIAKADTLAIGEPVTENLIPADASSAADLPYEPHRRAASLAFKYNVSLFALTLPVVVQKEAAVFTTIVRGVVVEQVLARDGMLNTHVTYLVVTSYGDRLPLTLPEGAELTAVLLNGGETPLEMGTSPEQRIVRLPPSAGQVSSFVVEISYGLRHASASHLTVPALPKEIPVQQTLWRLWIPQDYYLLGHNRVFCRVQPHQSLSLLARLQFSPATAAQGLPPAQVRPLNVQVDFKLSGQGKAVDFVRQGAPGQLSARVVGKEVLSVIVWVLTIAAGLAMLKLTVYRRAIVILAAVFVAGLVRLYLPLLVDQVVRVGAFAAVLVLLLWIVHALYVRLPELRGCLAARRQAALERKRTAKTDQMSEKKKAEPAKTPKTKRQDQLNENRE
jgi:hypothetical protein